MRRAATRNRRLLSRALLITGGRTVAITGGDPGPEGGDPGGGALIVIAAVAGAEVPFALVA